MKRYNRWFNFITSLVVDFVATLFFIFSALPCYSVEVYPLNPKNPYDYRVYTYSLFDPYSRTAYLGMIFMFIFVILATASLVIDILHAAGPFKENRAYRNLHLSFSTACFGLLVIAIPLFSVTLAQPHHFEYAALHFAFSCVVILCALEIVRSVLGIVAVAKARRPATENAVSTPKEAEFDSDYVVKKLKDLKDLLSAGIISEEEYNEAKKKYVKDL